MKKFVMSALTIACAHVIWAGGVSPVHAQDPLAVAPKMYRLLFENERVRVMEVTFNPGDSILPHSHPDHHVYAVSGGTLRITTAKGSNDAVIKTGDVLFIPAEIHWAKNIGATPVRLIVNELKEPRPAASADDDDDEGKDEDDKDDEKEKPK